MKTELLKSFVEAKSFHLGKGMHDYVSEQDIRATYSGLKDPVLIESFLEYIASEFPQVITRAGIGSKKKGFVQVPAYLIGDQTFYTEMRYIKAYVNSSQA